MSERITVETKIPPRLVRDIVFIKILDALHWKGTHMVFPFADSPRGERRMAVIHLKDLLKIIKWEKFK